MEYVAIAAPRVAGCDRSIAIASVVGEPIEAPIAYASPAMTRPTMSTASARRTRPSVTEVLEIAMAQGRPMRSETRARSPRPATSTAPTTA